MSVSIHAETPPLRLDDAGALRGGDFGRVARLGG